MAQFVFDLLRSHGGRVDVRRIDDDGGFALASIGGLEVSVDVYPDREIGEDRVALFTREGDHAVVSVGEVVTTLAAMGGEA